MLGGGGGWKVPFDVACARDQGYIAKIDDLAIDQLVERPIDLWKHLELQVESRLRRSQLRQNLQGARATVLFDSLEL